MTQTFDILSSKFCKVAKIQEWENLSLSQKLSLAFQLQPKKQENNNNKKIENQVKKFANSPDYILVYGGLCQVVSSPSQRQKLLTLVLTHGEPHMENINSSWSSRNLSSRYFYFQGHSQRTSETTVRNVYGLFPHIHDFMKL